jgi:hypothetical protein
MNAKHSRSLEEAFERMHNNPPVAFNLDARPCLHDAVSAAYAGYWERNPGSTRDQAREFYRVTYEALRSSFPSHRETLARKESN